MKCHVGLLKWSAWSPTVSEDGPIFPTGIREDSASFYVDVDANDHHEAYRQAYYMRHGEYPSEESVMVLSNFKVVDGKVTFFLDDNDLPISGMPGQPADSHDITPSLTSQKYWQKRAAEECR